MRWLLLLGCFALGACDDGGLSCPCADPSQLCVYVSSNAPICLPACSADGGCGSGSSCICATTCLSCGDCKHVCN